MKQLDLFDDGLNGIQESDLKTPKIYESPDGGKTVYSRDFGSDPATRILVQAPVGQLWNITFGSPNGA